MSEYVRVPCPRMLCVPGDIHCPNQDDKALACMTLAVEGTMELLGFNRTDTELALTGDTFNSAGFSPHPVVRRNVERGGRGTVADEIAAFTPWANTWSSLFGTMRILAGNHEAWQDSELALSGGKWWDVYGDLLQGFYKYPEATKLLYGKVTVCHGHDLRASLAKNSAIEVLKEYPGQNTVYGHTHRLQACTTPTTKNGIPRAHGAYTVGMMADRELEREDRNFRKFSDRHQQGFGLVYFTRRGFKVELCEIFQQKGRYWTVAAGREYAC